MDKLMFSNDDYNYIVGDPERKEHTCSYTCRDCLWN